MQGRLVPPEPGRLQAFPRTRWADEFRLASEIPVSYIEWIYDLYGADVNPLTSDTEPSLLRTVIEGSGVAVRSLCADYFMERPFLRCTAAEREGREQFLQQLVRRANRIGVQRIVLPFVDASRIETAVEGDTVVRVLRNALPTARETGMELHLETALGPAEFAHLLNRIPDPLVKVNYDSGNSACLGYSPSDEFAAYGDRVGSVHIKDRLCGGGTVALGSGAADFSALFRALEKVDYRGDFTLQVARPENGAEIEWAQRNRSFLARYWGFS